MSGVSVGIVLKAEASPESCRRLTRQSPLLQVLKEHNYDTQRADIMNCNYVV
jgi:hypothetical protein